MGCAGNESLRVEFENFKQEINSKNLEYSE